MTQAIQRFSELSDKYQGFLFDAYGVLVDDRAIIPGAAEVWEELTNQGKSLWILTNGSSKSLAEAAAAYRLKGISVAPEQIINSASLLKGYFQEKELLGQRTAVLGTSSSRQYALDAGACVIDPLQEDFEVLVVANQTEYPFLETVDQVITRIFARYEKGLRCELILTNPDLIFPKDKGQFGVTSGAVAVLIERALEARLGKLECPRFEKLGKPYSRIFDEAIRRAGTRQLLMIGDQLETDIRGAESAGLDSLLIGTGLIDLQRWQWQAGDPHPTYTLSAWS
jgi:HAD superfamily hydrolase (TIGR01450 family)